MRKKNNTRAYVIVIILLLIVLIIPPIRGGISNLFLRIVSPFQTVFSNQAKDSRGFFSALFEIKRIKNENSELAEKLKSCSVDQTLLDELERENDILKKQLGFLAEHAETDLKIGRASCRERV